MFLEIHVTVQYLWDNAKIFKKELNCGEKLVEGNNCTRK